jgi:phosphatidylinositol phospholipase C, delta
MADPQPSAPRRVLRRAANLLTSSGQPAIPDLAFVNDDVQSAPPSNRRFSLRQKFQEVKDASKTLTARSKAPTVILKPLEIEHKPSSTASRRDLRPYSQSVFGSRPMTSSTSQRHSLDTSPAPSRRLSLPAPTMSTPSTSRTDLSSSSESVADITVPELLQTGTPMTKVSTSKHKKYVFRIDPDQGQIVYESKVQKAGMSSPPLYLASADIVHCQVPIEAIKEMRFGPDARYDREQFQLSREYEDRWITVIYILEGAYKTLHLIAATQDVFNMWRTTLLKMYAVRQQLMTGLGNLQMRETLWEKNYWRCSDQQKDQKLDYSEIEKLCRRLNINSSSEDLFRLFKVKFYCCVGV